MYRFVLAIGLLLFTFSLVAQPKFTTVCSERTIGKNEFVNVEYMIENVESVQKMVPPAFRGFTIVSGPNQQTGMSNINGVVKQYISIGYVLKPQSVGKFTIAGAYAKADGKDLRSQSVAIEVKNDYPQQQTAHEYDDYILKRGENVEEKARKNLFVRVEANRTSCYVGEPIIASYKLYTRLKSESSLTGAPSFTGFSVTDLGSPGDYPLTNGKFKGREYSVYTLRKVQLYPLQSGRLELEPAEVENRITFIKEEYAASLRGDIFYDMLKNFADATAPSEALRQQSLTIKSEPLMITVNPLPANAPESFKGAVGKFRIKASLENNSVSTTDIGNLRVVISGTGNLQMINAPKVAWPAGIDGFEGKVSENMDKMSVPMKGDKIFVYPFSVSEPGKYQVPAIRFSYFDPSTSTYKTINTDPFDINVVKGQPPAVNTLQKSIPATSMGGSFLLSKWTVIAGLLFSGLLIFWFVKRKRQQQIQFAYTDIPVPAEVKEEATETKIESELLSGHPLDELEEKLTANDSTAFYSCLNTSLRSYLSAKLKIPAGELTRKKISEKLDHCNVGVGTSIILDSLLQDIEMHLYAPVANQKMQEVFEKATEVVSLLEKQC